MAAPQHRVNPLRASNAPAEAQPHYAFAPKQQRVGDGLGLGEHGSENAQQQEQQQQQQPTLHNTKGESRMNLFDTGALGPAAGYRDLDARASGPVVTPGALGTSTPAPNAGTAALPPFQERAQAKQASLDARTPLLNHEQQLPAAMPSLGFDQASPAGAAATTAAATTAAATTTTTTTGAATAATTTTPEATTTRAPTLRDAPGNRLSGAPSLSTATVTDDKNQPIGQYRADSVPRDATGKPCAPGQRSTAAVHMSTADAPLIDQALAAKAAARD